MFEPRNIAEARMTAPQAVMDSADTTITVNSGGSAQPPRPNFRVPTRTVETTAYAPGQPIASTSTQRQINWGGVIKGIAVVAAVALAGVAVYGLVAPAVTAALTDTALGATVNSVVAAVGPAFSWVADTAISGALGIGHFVESFAVSLFGGTLGGAATVGTVAAAPAVGSATGALAGGVALAASVPLAKSVLATTPMVDTVHMSHASAPALTGLDAAAPAHYGPRHEGHLNNLLDMPDMHEQMASMKTSSKLAHHAAHSVESGSHAGADSMEGAPDAPEHRAHNAIRNSAQASEAWAERVGHPRPKAAIAQRSSQFSTQLADERAQLDAAMGTHHIG